MSSCLRGRVEAQAGSMNFLTQLGQALREILLQLHPFSTSGTHPSWAGPLSKALLEPKADIFKRLKFLQLKKEKEGLEYGHSRATTQKS